MNRDLSDIRKDFTKNKLTSEDLDRHPIVQFKLWLNEAIEHKEKEPTAMTLCTVSEEGIPSARIVLLKKLDDEGKFWFFTNYKSKKGNDIETNKHVAVNFFWPELERQVRITGIVEKIAEADSETYFQSRPLDSQISAIASPQSQVVESRKQLENWFNAAKEKPAKKPDDWGGYCVKPSEIEFWQGRSGRLHDRIRYRVEQNKWLKERLAP